MYCLSSFCCVCLNDEAKLHDINELDSDGLPFINKIIFVSFGHEAIDFKVVRYICVDCVNILQLAYKFKRSCLMNHELLRIYSGQLKYFTGKVSEYKNLIVSLEELQENDENDDTEDNCEHQSDENEEDSATDASVLPTYKSVYTPRKTKIRPKIMKCGTCDAIFHRYVELQVHYTTKHKSLFKVTKLKHLSKNGSFSYNCNICSKKLATLFSLTRHLQLHASKQTQVLTPKIPIPTSPTPSPTPPTTTTTTLTSPTQIPITCLFCPTLIENKETYQNHMLTNHADIKTLCCNICDVIFDNDLHFRRHMGTKHSPKKCSHCEQLFVNNSKLLAHVTENHRIYKCNTCDKAFCHQRNLHTHMKTHKFEVYDRKKSISISHKVEPNTEVPSVRRTVKRIPEPMIETKVETKTPYQNALLNLGIRKKCTNCLSIFSSALSLKKHKCFNLETMFQCNKCFIIYSKKAAFTKHVNCCCVLPSNRPGNIANTPELQESEQSEINAGTNFVEAAPTTTTTTTHEQNVIKDENDLEIKEEILEDFFCNSQEKENSIEIGDVYSINEFTEAENNQNVGVASQSQRFDAPEKTDNGVNAKKPLPKKTFPKIKLVQPNKRASEENLDIIQTVRKRWDNLHIPIEKLNDVDGEVSPDKSTVTPEVTNAGDKDDLRRKSGLFDDVPIDTIFSNTEELNEFSDSNDSTVNRIDMQNIIDPLFANEQGAKSNNTSRSTSVSRDDSLYVNKAVNVAEMKKYSNRKRRKSIWVDGITNIDDTEAVSTTNSKTIESSNIQTVSSNIDTGESSKNRIDLFKSRRKSICTIISSNENSNDSDKSEKVGVNKTSAKQRRKSFWTEDIVELNDNCTTDDDNPENLESNIMETITKTIQSTLSEMVESAITGKESTITEIEESQKEPVKRRRKSVWVEDTSNENSRESLIMENTDKDGAKKGPVGGTRRKSIHVDNVESNDSFSVDNVINTETVESQKGSVKKRRKSIWVEDTSNENSRESLIMDNSDKDGAKKDPIRNRRKSVWEESTSNDNSNESLFDKIDNLEPGEMKVVPIKRRRTSIWMELNDELFDENIESIGKGTTVINPVKSRRKSSFIENSNSEIFEGNERCIKNKERQEKNLNLEPIILTTRRSMKHSIKSRRKTICALSRKPETQQMQKPANTSRSVVEPSDVNENVANVDEINDPMKLNSVSGSDSTIQTFKLRSLRLNSVCNDGQTPRTVDDLNIGQNVAKNNDTSYITVRKVSDINNDVSGQLN